MQNLLLSWFVNAIGILLTAYLLPGISIEGFGSAAVTALVLGVVNAFVRPLFVILTIPLTILAFGLFILVINSLMVLLTSSIVPGFRVENFGYALLFGIVLSLINGLIYAIVK